MAYPGTFYRLVLLGNLYADTFNTTLAFVPTGGSSVPEIDQSFLDDLAVPIAAWWPLTTASNGIGITQNAALTGFKLNRIGPDGKYVDPETLEHTFTTPIAGGGPTGTAPQLALACTIRGANERARAGRGRMYLPSNSYSAVGVDGRMLIGNAANAAQRFHQFLQNMDGVFIDNSVPALAGIASKSGAGGFQVMNSVSVGRVVDTIRSRRSKLEEDPQYFPVPA